MGSENRRPREDDPDRKRGLYGKFRVERVNQSDKHGDQCFYFVLDLTHDAYAEAAVLAYAAACQEDYPLLARDLRKALLEKIG